MTTAPSPAPSSGRSGTGPAPPSLAEQRQAENFPVALRLLPAATRRHLVAVYDVARHVDDLGDEADGDRLARLDAFEADLHRVWEGGQPSEPVLRRLVPTARALDLSPEPFRKLVAANRQDQRVTSYATWLELADYCRLSADPVGHLVLAVFGVTDRTAAVLSDRVCTGLQLLEHCQDVAEDALAGRVYLPEDDQRAFGVRRADLVPGPTPPAVRQLVAFETDRAAALLDQGAPLVGLLHGWARIAVAGYLAGGRATATALRRAGHDVLRTTPRPRRSDVVAEAVALLARPPR